MLNRIKKYIDYKHINVSAFERSIGMSNASFGKSLKNGGSIGGDKLEIILNVYPDINPEWLLTGNGPMIKNKQPEASNPDAAQPVIDSNSLMPFLRRFEEIIAENTLLKHEINQLKLLLSHSTDPQSNSAK